MHHYHQELLKEITKASEQNPSIKVEDKAHYLGTTKPIVAITTPITWGIIRKWVKLHSNLSLEELLQVLNSLFQGETYTERALGGKLLSYFPHLRKDIDPICIDHWLTGAEGWAEVDSLCQSSFTAEDLLNKWKEWEFLIKNLSKSPFIPKRRASLVLLTKPVKESDDKSLTCLAWEMIDTLKTEKNILITKAISWLLRSLLLHHAKKAACYLEENEKQLPKIALLEAKQKLSSF